MKIMVIIPGDMSQEEAKRREDYLKQFILSPDTEIKAFPIKGPKQVRSGMDVLLLTPGVVEKAREGEGDKFDAIIIHGICDFGAGAAKEAVDIPVVGAGELAFHMACLVADKFGVITLLDECIPEFLRRWQLTDHAKRISSIRAYNIPVLEFAQRKDELEAKFTELAEEQVREGAQAIINACLALFSALGPGAKERIEQRIGVPVIDGAQLAVGTAEMMVNLKLKQSRKAYPRPRQ